MDLQAFILKDPESHQGVEDPRIELRMTGRWQEDDDLVTGPLHLLGQLAHHHRQLILHAGHDKGLRDPVGGHLLDADRVDHPVRTLPLAPHRDLGDLADSLRECGGEEERLPTLLAGQNIQQLLNLRAETHVQQPVGLVEDEHAEVPEERREAWVLQEGDEAPGRCNHHGWRRQSPQHVQLHPDAFAADYAMHSEARVVESEERPRLLGGLLRQLPRWREAQDANLPLGWGIPHDTHLKCRDEEAKCLAGAGLGLGNNISARQARLDGLRLHLRHRNVLEHLRDGEPSERRNIIQVLEQLVCHVALG
mmetsp:Transcript_57302/g.177864  ORF Transcript_57302/g.177864 Transcript_57302/m.177864 type:complete len:307 (+) Transcript_57302:604-1524(+)